MPATSAKTLAVIIAFAFSSMVSTAPLAGKTKEVVTGEVAARLDEYLKG